MNRNVVEMANGKHGFGDGWLPASVPIRVCPWLKLNLGAPSEAAEVLYPLCRPSSCHSCHSWSKKRDENRGSRGSTRMDSNDLPTPSVFALNGILANLAVMEFIAMTTGIREPARRLTYKGERGVVTISEDKRSADCFTCASCGSRERANIWRYVL